MTKKVDLLPQFVFGMHSSKYRTPFGGIPVEDTIDNTQKGIFSDVTQFYIYEHRTRFSKYFIIIQYAYRYGVNLLVNNK